MGSGQSLWLKNLGRVRTQAKQNELGWADFRLTHYSQIQKWWEVVCSAYLMVGLHSDVLSQSPTSSAAAEKFSEHGWWDSSGAGKKSE